MSEGTERTPLIHNEANMHPTYSHQMGDQLPSAPLLQSNYVSSADINELPPPYASIQDNNTVICRVCSLSIDITNRWDQHVVKCASCNEATPIKSAPVGRKYIRCPCNCLLVCNNTSKRIACPRPNCKRVINLVATTATPNFPSAPGMCQILCGHCDQLFLYSTLSSPLARCPKCRRMSSFRADYVSSRRVVWSGLFFLLLLIFASLVIYSAFHYTHAWIVGYVILALLIFISAYKSVYYIGTKVSTIEGPV